MAKPKTLKSYQCVRCLKAHELPPDIPYTPKPGEVWGDQPQEVRDNAHARNLYKSHRKYMTDSPAGEAIARLRVWLKPGAPILISIPHVAPSGMSRLMRVYADGGAACLTYNVALACDFPFNRERDALRIGGCGMDMTLALVDVLAHTLYPDGYKCIGATCPHPSEWDEAGKKRAHEKHHRANGNWTFPRRTV